MRPPPLLMVQRMYLHIVWNRFFLAMTLFLLALLPVPWRRLTLTWIPIFLIMPWCVHLSTQRERLVKLFFDLIIACFGARFSPNFHLEILLVVFTF